MISQFSDNLWRLRKKGGMQQAKHPVGGISGKYGKGKSVHR
jgi:hypothetical protein